MLRFGEEQPALDDRCESRQSAASKRQNNSQARRKMIVSSD